MQPELIADTSCHTGENPLWHPLERRVYWTDIPRGRLYRYDPATGSHEECYRGEPVGGFTVQTDGALLLFMARGAIATWREGRLDYLLRELPDERESRFNDVIADPAGRVFCGTMSTPTRPGRLYRLDTDGSLHLVLEGIGCSNGMAFTPDRRHFYHTDSTPQRITLFDYNEATGGLSGARVWLHSPDVPGVPDGMTVDAEGYVWSTRWGGSTLHRYTPDGVEVQRVTFPVKNVSSVTFGGDDLSDLYITTALAGRTRAEEGSGAGALFRLRPGVRGVPEFFSRVTLDIRGLMG